MKTFNKGDWVESINPFCAPLGLPSRYLPGREGIVVGEEGDQVLVLYTGHDSPVLSDPRVLEKIEVDNET